MINVKFFRLLAPVLFLVFGETAFAKSGGSRSKSGGPSAIRFTLHTGLTDQAFPIEEGADFSSIKQNYYALAIEKKGAKWTWGFQYFTAPAANLKSFWLDAVTEGKYKITFTRYQFLGGYRYSRWNFQLLLGTESSTWSGTPELGLKKESHLHYGAVVTVDLMTFRRAKIPFILTYINHPARTYEFEKFASSTIEVGSGSEIALGTGLAFEF